MTDPKFRIGQKVWARSEGHHPQKPPRGTYAGVIIDILTPEEIVFRNMDGPSYEVIVPGVINRAGTSAWYIEQTHLRPRDDGPETFPELVIEDDNPKQPVKWDWKRELKVDCVEVPA